MLISSTSVDVFRSSPGSVLVLTKVAKNGFSAILTGQAGGNQVSIGTGTSYTAIRCIVTSITLSESANFQFLPTLRNMTYLYTFGDKISELDVGGIAFLNPECDGVSGVHSVYDFFTENKMSKTLKPITLSLVSFSDKFNTPGRTMAFQAFLGSFNMSITDPASMLAQFSLKMYYMPQTASDTPYTDALRAVLP